MKSLSVAGHGERPGGYHCAGVDIRREVPVDFWIKLPLSPDEMRRCGQDIPHLYPDLQARWDSHNKLWRWAVPAIEAVPDMAPAIDLTSRYQPATGPMQTPAAEPG